jgi:short-subunit dehydrogenase
MRSVQYKRAFITGAASGIGRAIALELARSDCHSCLIDIDEAGLARTVGDVQRLGVEAFGLVCDVGKESDIHVAIDQMLCKWPEIDILVNNAGVTYRGRSAEMATEDWQRLLAVNLNGPMQFCQRLLPVLLRRPEAHVLNVCSLLGLCGFSHFSAYSASKFGLVGYSEALRAEYLGSQLGVSAICPGFVRTPFIESVPGTGGVRRKRSTPKWLTTTAEVVARKSVRAIHRNKGLVVVTPLAHMLWWLKRLAPGWGELARPFRSRRIAPPIDTAEFAKLEMRRKSA